MFLKTTKKFIFKGNQSLIIRLSNIALLPRAIPTPSRDEFTLNMLIESLNNSTKVIDRRCCCCFHILSCLRFGCLISTYAAIYNNRSITSIAPNPIVIILLLDYCVYFCFILVNDFLLAFSVFIALLGICGALWNCIQWQLAKMLF